MATVSDRRTPISAGGTHIDYYEADVTYAALYYPFGMEMKTYKADSSGYRYGFGGQERDNEIAGNGNSYTAEYWQYDARIGKRFNIDPMTARYPWQSPYACFNDNPIIYADPQGLEGIPSAEQIEEYANWGLVDPTTLAEGDVQIDNFGYAWEVVDGDYVLQKGNTLKKVVLKPNKTCPGDQTESNEPIDQQAQPGDELEVNAEAMATIGVVATVPEWTFGAGVGTSSAAGGAAIGGAAIAAVLVYGAPMAYGAYQLNEGIHELDYLLQVKGKAFANGITRVAEGSVALAAASNMPTNDMVYTIQYMTSTGEIGVYKYGITSQKDLNNRPDQQIRRLNREAAGTGVTYFRGTNYYAQSRPQALAMEAALVFNYMYSNGWTPPPGNIRPFDSKYWSSQDFERLMSALKKIGYKIK